MAKTIRLVLGDQLNSEHSWFQSVDENCLFLMMEMRQETDYTRHHIQKVAGFFLAMRTFCAEMKAAGHYFLYLQLDHPDNRQNLEENLLWVLAREEAERFEYQLPDEFRLDAQLKTICQKLQIPAKEVDSEHFLTRREDLMLFFQGKKTYLMESFYRQMRLKWNLLMEKGKPEGGQWNYDAENRKKLPENHPVPPALEFRHNVYELVEMIKKAGVESIGNISPEKFPYPKNRTQSLQLLEHFCQYLLPDFGRYEDAMDSAQPYVFHSRLSFALNLKMISPLEVVQQAISAYQKRKNEIDLAQIEGFVRQIIGWREYMRGIYWAKMPEFSSLNFFDHQALLPSWFWTGKTKMNCLKHCIGQSLELAYAHHIQRLMVTGNFALLLGVHPDEVDAWYLGIYIDAIEWVEITNTRGMSQYADGGIVGSKPYVSSAAYIHKMSNYCSHCHYDKNLKTGSRACPFNSLYWDFYHRHAEKLSRNPRIGMMYNTWAKMKDADKKAILERAEWVKENVEQL
jgi:deoxyribodipyrimidine photolyase-related protein